MKSKKGTIKSESTKPKENLQNIQGHANFETAISATGYGKFNILLLAITIPPAFTVQFESTLPSYILPAAECDLNLTLGDKGFINSAAFIGMIVGGPIWGFLLDTIGRKKMILIGSSLNFLVGVASSFTQTSTYMAICKLLGGSLSGGIYIASMTYLQEFHSLKYRGRIQMVFGIIYAIANLSIPVLASFFLPFKFDVIIFNLIELRSWNLFIMATSAASLTTAISFFFLPETPKYLMSAGRSPEAIAVFQKVYKTNTGQSPDSYPVSKLAEEKLNSHEDGTQCQKSFKEYLMDGWKQISPLFGKQYIPRMILVCTLQPLMHMLLNTFRLWLPQIFQSIHDYQVNYNDTTASLCTMLKVFHPNETDADAECSVNLENNFSVYFNSMVIALVTMGGFSIASFLITLFGRKRLMITLGMSSSVIAMSIYFSQNVATILALASLQIALTSVSFDIVLSIIVVLFPTTLRGTAVSIILLIGRIFTSVGNMVFPILLETSCEAPFSALAAGMFVCTCLAFLLPNTENTDLE